MNEPYWISGDGHVVVSRGLARKLVTECLFWVEETPDGQCMVTDCAVAAECQAVRAWLEKENYGGL